MSEDTQALCSAIVDQRCEELGLDRTLIASVQYGDASATFPDDDHLGATVVSPDGYEWMILISDKTPMKQLDEVVTHEVLHVFFQSEGDEGEETLVNLAAKLLQDAYPFEVTI